MVPILKAPPPLSQNAAPLLAGTRCSVAQPPSLARITALPKVDRPELLQPKATRSSQKVGGRVVTVQAAMIPYGGFNVTMGSFGGELAINYGLQQAQYNPVNLYHDPYQDIRPHFKSTYVSPIQIHNLPRKDRRALEKYREKNDITPLNVHWDSYIADKLGGRTYNPTNYKGWQISAGEYGRPVGRNGERLDQGEYMYVVTTGNEFRYLPKHAWDNGGFDQYRSHSQLAGGGLVYAAGGFKVDSYGYIVEIDNYSGHYRPPGKKGVYYAINLLERMGVKTKAGKITFAISSGKKRHGKSKLGHPQCYNFSGIAAKAHEAVTPNDKGFTKEDLFNRNNLKSLYTWWQWLRDDGQSDWIYGFPRVPKELEEDIPF
ncbi:MAG: hypothetical protein A2516_00695 [Alphaproteobacteria bacterium RIFOXYD12_FULL_60_8]|nr:MAG: hypothetical protein A2516_00695 [Alphaproteobacteria bacterium RIFOXYD12_FULL_60_8]